MFKIALVLSIEWGILYKFAFLTFKIDIMRLRFALYLSAAKPSGPRTVGALIFCFGVGSIHP